MIVKISYTKIRVVSILMSGEVGYGPDPYSYGRNSDQSLRTREFTT